MINTVPDITKNLVYVTWTNPDVANNMNKLTAEALIRVSKFDKMLTSIMGIEGKFLLRIGDAGIPQNQLQVATSSGNVTDESLAIPTNEWTHIAVTYDADAKTVIVYINGKNMLETTLDCGAVNWCIRKRHRQILSFLLSVVLVLHFSDNTYMSSSLYRSSPAPLSPYR